MLGVDKLDQLVSYYSFLHRSVKWWRKVFFWLLEVAVVNSYIIYKQNCTQNKIRPMTHLAFRRSLIDSLTEPLRSSAKPSGIRVEPSHKRLECKPHFMGKHDKRTDCVVCSDRRGGKRHLTHFHCDTCTDHPSLCPTDCFKLYHTKKNYSQ